MSEPHVIAALREKRAEIGGHIQDLEKQATALRANLANIDAAIRLLSPGADPTAIPPRRSYRRTKYFTRNELGRLALDVLRKAPAPLATREVVIPIMKAKGLAIGDDGLFASINEMALVALRALAKRGAVVKSGTSRDARWALTPL